MHTLFQSITNYIFARAAIATITIITTFIPTLF